jgi:hypothetical protein
MASEQVTRSPRAALAVGLLLIGLLSLGLWRVISGSEHQAFAKGATPAESYQVTEGKQYSLAVPGGVSAMHSHGIAELTDPSGSKSLALTCLWSVNGSGSQALNISIEAVDTKAETTVAHFTAPVSGRLSVTCDGWGRMFIPDAGSGSSDPAGWFLMLSIITLTIGAALAMSAGYATSVQRAELRARWAAEDAAEAAPPEPFDISTDRS